MITSLQLVPANQNFKSRHPKAPRGSAELKIKALQDDINNQRISKSAAGERVVDLMGEVGVKGRRALRVFRETFLGNQLS